MGVILSHNCTSFEQKNPTTQRKNTLVASPQKNVPPLWKSKYSQVHTCHKKIHTLWCIVKYTGPPHSFFRHTFWALKIIHHRLVETKNTLHTCKLKNSPLVICILMFLLAILLTKIGVFIELLVGSLAALVSPMPPITLTSRPSII